LLHRFRRSVSLAVLLALCAAPACTKPDKKAAPASSTAAASPTPSPSPTPTPTPTPTPKPAAQPKPKPKPKPKPVYFHPLVGGKAKAGEVVAVKIDNTGGSKPQSQLGQADVIYQELVEAGLTRLMAIYSTKRPTNVGPVRSARESDIEILKPFGKVILAYSGAQRGVLRRVRRANLVNGRIDDAGSAYYLSRHRRRPYSTFVSVRRMMQIRAGANARDIGLRFGKLGGARIKKASVARAWWSTSTRNEFRWDGKRWRVSRNGTAQVAVDNVLIQRVRTQRSPYHDVNGSNSPRTIVSGKGTGMLLRDGRRISLTWSRKTPGAPTVYVDLAGKPVLLKPGTTYIALLPLKGRFSVR
jgi:hypothetical protein